jgi:hypothetical protein
VPTTHSAAGSLSGSGSLGGAVTLGSSVSMTGSGTLGAANLAVPLFAAARMSVAARVIKNAVAALAASPSLTASGTVPMMIARPALGATATVRQNAAAGLHAPGTLTAVTSASAAHLAAAPKLLAPGRMAAARLLAGTSLSASGQYFLPGQASLFGGAVLHAAAKVTEPGSAHLAASTSVAALALLHTAGSAPLSAPGHLTAAPFSAAAHLAGSPQLTAAGGKTALALSALHAPGSVTAAAKVTEHAGTALHGSAVLSPRGMTVKVARAVLSASAALHAAGVRGVAGHAALVSAPALSARGARTAVARAALTAVASAAVAGQELPGARLSAVASLSAGAVLSRAGHGALSGAARLAGTAHGTTFPKAAFQATGTFLPAPLGIVRGQAPLAVSPCMSVTAQTAPKLPFPLRPSGPQPAWQRDVQRFAVIQERQRHAQALWQYGELAVFCLLWRPEDITAGLAQRCTRCYVPSRVITDLPPGTVPPAGYYSIPGVEAQISAAYGQGSQFRCTLCYGTQVIAAQSVKVPGVRALLVRPAILTDTDQNQQRTAKGVVNTGSVAVQSTPDFRVSTLDYLFRSDGRRYQLQVPARTTLRTGFASPWQASAGISYNLANATLEDPRGSVAYVIPPPGRELERVLGAYTRVPADYAFIEQVNGPLIPGEDPPPAALGSYQPSVTLGTS